MNHPTILSRIRHIAPALASAIYVLWLSILCTPIPLGGCCSGESEEECPEGSCEQPGFRYVAISVNEKGIESLGPEYRSWTFTVSGAGMTTLSGSFDSMGSLSPGSVCVPVNKTITVDITEDPAQPPPNIPPTTPDPTIQPPSDPEQSPGSYNTDISEDPPSEPIPNTSPVTVSYPSSGANLLDFKWCEDCGGTKTHSANLGPTKFRVDSGKCTASPGKACTDLKSVDFRVNLGRMLPKGEPLQLTIQETTIAACLDTASVQFPSVINRYELEIWHWFGYNRDYWGLDESETPPDVEIGGFSSELSGRRYTYQFVGEEGYKNLFKLLGLAPVKRATSNLSPGPVTPGAPLWRYNEPWLTVDQQNIPDNAHGADKEAHFDGGPIDPGDMAATPGYADGVRQTTWGIFEASPKGIASSSSFFSIGGQDGATSDESLDDYVRAHFIRGPRFSSTGMPDLTGDQGTWNDIYTDEAFTLPIDYNTQPIRLTQERQQGDPISVNFSVPSPAHPSICLGSTYRVRNITISNPGNASSTPGPNGSKFTVGPDVCVNIVPLANPALGYDILAYWRSQISAGQDGNYTIAGTHFAKWEVRQGNTANELRIREFRSEDPTTAVETNTWAVDGAIWSLTKERGNWKEVHTKQPRVQGGHVETEEIFDLSFTPPRLSSYTSTTTNINGKVLEVAEGAPGVAGEPQRITTYVYDSASPYRLLYMTRSDGYFERYLTGIGNANYGSGVFKATVRPWQGTVFNANDNETKGAATLRKTVDTGTEQVTTELELINGQKMSETVTTRSIASVSYLTYRPAGQPVERIEVERRSFALPTLVSRTVTEKYINGAVPSLVGQMAYRLDADGIATIYHHYKPGRLSGNNFVQGEGNCRLVYEMKYYASTTGLTMLERITENRIIVTDSEGRTLSESLCVWDGGHNRRMTTTTHTYKVDGQLAQTVKDGRVTYTATFAYMPQPEKPWDNPGKKMDETDETGARVTFVYGSQEEPLGYEEPDFGALDGLPAIVGADRAAIRDVEGRISLEGISPFLKRYEYDTQGRLRTQTDEMNGLVTTHTYSYATGVNTHRIDYPGEAYQITATYVDGQLASTGGNMAPTQTIDRYPPGTALPQGLSLPSGFPSAVVVEAVTSWDNDSQLSSVRAIDGLGRTLGEYIISFNGTNRTGCWRTFTYDAAGRVTAEYVDGEIVRSHTFPPGQPEVETIYAHPSPNQVHTMHASYVLVEETNASRWWRKIQTDQGFSRERIQFSGLANLISETYSQDEFGRVTKQTAVSDTAGTVNTFLYDPRANNPTITTTRGGLLQRVTEPNGRVTVYGYDGSQRIETINQPGQIATQYTYDSVYGKPATVTTSGDTLGEFAQTVTSMTYHPATSPTPGQVQTRNVDGRVTNYTYYPSGDIKAIWGADYPQKYEYRHGRLFRLHTYRSAPAGEPTAAGDVTEWTYMFGRLWKKSDAQNRTVTCYYDTKGRLQNRFWARGVGTTYGYDRAGQLRTIDYSDSTPDVTISRDAEGRVVNVTTNGPVATIGYVHGASSPAENVTVDGSVFGGSYSISRNTNYSLANPTVSVKTGTLYSGNDGVFQEDLPEWGYETAGGTMTNANGMAIVRHPLTQEIQSGTYGQTLKFTRTADGLGRLKRVETGIQGGAVKAFTEYTYLNGQRQQAATDRGTWHYGYNARGEVNSGVKRIGSDVPGYNFGYQFDGIGNRESATQNGIENVYTPNALNQYEQRTVPAYYQIRGVAKAIPVTPPASPVEPEGVAVKLEGPQSPYTEAAFGPANYFGLALPVPAPGNQNNAVWKGITVEAWASNATNEYKVTETRKDFLPKSPEDYDYDWDGNLIKDGRWTYEWDAENRLTSMTARTVDFPGQTLPSGMDVGKLEFKYDWVGRRMVKLVYGQNGTTLKRWTSFAYDGWQLVLEAERHLINGANARVITRNYYWGPDISGEMEGAGGVGGLVSVQISDHNVSAQTTISDSLVPAYDGNSNIVAYLDRATGNIAQEEEYGPFGEPLRSRSASTLRSPIRWSTKYTDEETGLVYYGYRYYSPQVGRWISRDPIGIEGGPSTYALVENRVLQSVDVLGLAEVSVSEKWGGVREDDKFLDGLPGKPLGKTWPDFKAETKCAQCQETKKWKLSEVTVVFEIKVFVSSRDRWRSRDGTVSIYDKLGRSQLILGEKQHVLKWTRWWEDKAIPLIQKATVANKGGYSDKKTCEYLEDRLEKDLKKSFGERLSTSDGFDDPDPSGKIPHRMDLKTGIAEGGFLTEAFILTEAGYSSARKPKFAEGEFGEAAKEKSWKHTFQ